jgi:hypothetical protein
MRAAHFAIALVLLALVGCASNQEKELGTTKGLAPGKGIAVMTVSFNGHTSWPTEVNFGTPPFGALWFVREDSPDREVNNAQTQLYGTNTTAVYSPELVAGRYRLLTFYSTYQESTGTGTMHYSFRWPLPRELGSVEIRPGQVTQLGNLVYDELEPRTEQYQLALDRDAEIEAAVLKGLFPNVAATATVSDTGWNPVAEQILTARRDAIAAASKLLLNPKRLADGTIIGGSTVGQVLRRDAKGKWQRLDTGTSFEVRTAVQLRDGRLLAGGEMGRLVVSGDGRDWKAAANAPPFGVIEWLDVQADGSLLAVVVQKKETLILSAASPDTGASWKELARISHHAYGSVGGTPLDRCHVQRAGDLMLIHHKAWRLDVFDLAAGQLRPPYKLRQLPYNVGNATVTDDGSIFVFMSKNADEAIGISNDRGVLWKSRTFGGRTTDIDAAYFGTARDGFRLVANEGENTWTSESAYRVETTADGGASWTAGRALPHLKHVWRLGPGEFLASATPIDGHALWWTKDSGKTWTSERLPGGR